MTRVAHERAVWLARHVLPHEAALRSWLRGKRIQGLEIDDIVQETYAVLASRESVEDVRNPKTYAFQIAYRVILTVHRRAKVVSIRGVEDVDALGATAQEVSPEQQVSDRDELQRLAQAIADLPPRTRQVFTLRRVDGLSQRQVAQRLGVTESSVEKHMGKALRILMTLFGRGGRAASGASTGFTQAEDSAFDVPAGYREDLD